MATSSLFLWQRAIHLIIATVLIVPATVQISGQGSYGAVVDMLFLGLPSMLGGLPHDMVASDWSLFHYNVSIAVGILYGWCGISGSAVLAAHLCFPRALIGVLNLAGVYAERLPLAFCLYGVVEIVSAAGILLTLPKFTTESSEKRD